MTGHHMATTEAMIGGSGVTVVVDTAHAEEVGPEADVEEAGGS